MFLSFLHNVEGFEYLFEKKQKQQRASSCFVSISWSNNMDVGDATRISTDRLTPQYRTDWQLATVKHQQNVEKEKTEEDEKHVGLSGTYSGGKSDMFVYRETPQGIFNN